MGSGRGDRNQFLSEVLVHHQHYLLQWGPVVVTGIRHQANAVWMSCIAGFNGVRSW